MTETMLWRVNASWRNNHIALDPGTVVGLTDDQVREILIDVPGGVEPLDAQTGFRILAGIGRLQEYVGVPLRLDWSPRPAQPYQARGGGPVMTTASGIIRGS